MFYVFLSNGFVVKKSKLIRNIITVQVIFVIVFISICKIIVVLSVCARVSVSACVL